MSRYFIEVSYNGANYSGFQHQQNANTIQAEIEKAVEVLQKEKVMMLCSSRTDAGVHALQNFFHFDFEKEICSDFVYKMNAILPKDIAVKKIIPVSPDSHCRFDALSREYKYFIYRYKDPFLFDRAFYFPYKLEMDKMQKAAEIIKNYSDFTSFSKRNTQVKTFNCNIMISEWSIKEDCLVYHVTANRFLRGMVRALTATMLKVGREKISLDEFKNIIEARDCTQASFSVPAHGLYLINIEFPSNFFSKDQ